MAIIECDTEVLEVFVSILDNGFLAQRFAMAKEQSDQVLHCVCCSICRLFYCKAIKLKIEREPQLVVISILIKAFKLRQNNESVLASIVFH